MPLNCFSFVKRERNDWNIIIFLPPIKINIIRHAVPFSHKLGRFTSLRFSLPCDRRLFSVSIKTECMWENESVYEFFFLFCYLWPTNWVAWDWQQFYFYLYHSQCFKHSLEMVTIVVEEWARENKQFFFLIGPPV